MADLSNDIQNAATTPAEVQNGDQRVKARTVAEMIEADKYLAAKAAAASSAKVVFSKLVPPGAR